jgi:hypothetical protein
MAQKKTDEITEQPLPNAPDRDAWTWRESEFTGGLPLLTFRGSIEALSSGRTGTGTRRRKTTTFDTTAIADEIEKAAEIVPEKVPGSWRKKGLPEGVRRLLPLLFHEFTDLEGFDEKEIRYGSERNSGLMNVKLRLKKKKRTGADGRGRGLGSYPILKRILPRLVSYGEEQEKFRFTFEGARPQSVHVLGRVLETSYKFRLEDLSRFATHGDHLLHALEHLDAPPCLDLDAILYVPGLDAEYPFKFVPCAPGTDDNYTAFVGGLKQLSQHAEGIETFKDRFFGELKLGFEKFGPACATPEFQEVELRVWTLISFACTALQMKIAELAHITDGPKIRDLLRKVTALHQAIDDCANLPSELAAYYRTHFDLPFAKLFEHSLTALDEIAKGIDCNLKDRPRDIQFLTEMVTRFRRIEPTCPLEDMEAMDAALSAAYANRALGERKHPKWVRRYEETIFTGTNKFDQRRYKSTDKPEKAVIKPERLSSSKADEGEDFQLDVKLDNVK